MPGDDIRYRRAKRPSYQRKETKSTPFEDGVQQLSGQRVGSVRGLAGMAKRPLSPVGLNPTDPFTTQHVWQTTRPTSAPLDRFQKRPSAQRPRTQQPSGARSARFGEDHATERGTSANRAAKRFQTDLLRTTRQIRIKPQDKPGRRPAIPRVRAWGYDSGGIGNTKIVYDPTKPKLVQKKKENESHDLEKVILQRRERTASHLWNAPKSEEEAKFSDLYGEMAARTSWKDKLQQRVPEAPVRNPVGRKAKGYPSQLTPRTAGPAHRTYMDAEQLATLIAPPD